MDSNPTFNPSKDKFDNLLPLQGHEEHYKDFYLMRNREVIDFFEENDTNRLIHCDLMDPDKWKKLGKFFGINVPEDFAMHLNKTKK